MSFVGIASSMRHRERQAKLFADRRLKAYLPDAIGEAAPRSAISMLRQAGSQYPRARTLAASGTSSTYQNGASDGLSPPSFTPRRDYSSHGRPPTLDYASRFAYIVTHRCHRHGLSPRCCADTGSHHRRTIEYYFQKAAASRRKRLSLIERRATPRGHADTWHFGYNAK